MKPILFNIGFLPISSFGVFLIIALLLSTFVIWRILKVYDIDEEKSLDVIFLTFIIGLVVARLYFVVLNLPQFNDVFKVFLINKYPGLGFWGGFLGGFVGLMLLSKKFKLNFWQIADFAVVGLFLGTSIISLGCLFGSCQYGLESKLPFAVTQIGIVGKRFPLQVIECLAFLLGFIYLNQNVLKFHVSGQILAKGLIIFGAIKFILEFFRGDVSKIVGVISLGHIFALLVFIFGVRLYYRRIAKSKGQNFAKVSKRSFKGDLRHILALFKSKEVRSDTFSKALKSWYNLRISWRLTLKRWRKDIFKLLNVKSNPNKF